MASLSKWPASIPKPDSNLHIVYVDAPTRFVAKLLSFWSKGSGGELAPEGPYGPGRLKLIWPRRRLRPDSTKIPVFDWQFEWYDEDGAARVSFTYAVMIELTPVRDDRTEVSFGWTETQQLRGFVGEILEYLVKAYSNVQTQLPDWMRPGEQANAPNSSGPKDQQPPASEFWQKITVMATKMRERDVKATMANLALEFAIDRTTLYDWLHKAGILPKEVKQLLKAP